MKMELWEVADKASILKVKKDKGLPVDGQYARYMKEIEQVPAELFAKLHEVNKAMFEMEDIISFAFENREFEMAGYLYYALRGMTHMRTKAKHAIASACGEPLEVKRYGKGY